MLNFLPASGPRVIKPRGRAVDVRSYSETCTTVAGAAAVALFSRQVTEFTELHDGTAAPVLDDSLVETNGIFGLEMFPMVAAVVALSAQPRGRRMILFVDNSVAAGALIKASSLVQAILAFLGVFGNA